MINQVSRNDWQYLIPFLIILVIFFATDILEVLNKLDFAYNSVLINVEKYRAITAHFLHADFSHLLANTFGIVMARYFLISSISSNF